MAGRYVSVRECELAREGMKESIDNVKEDVHIILTNHLPHIHTEIKDVSKKLDEFKKNQSKEYNKLATKISAVTTTVTLLFSLLLKYWGIV